MHVADTGGIEPQIHGKSMHNHVERLSWLRLPKTSARTPCGHLGQLDNGKIPSTPGRAWLQLLCECLHAICVAVLGGMHNGNIERVNILLSADNCKHNQEICWLDVLMACKLATAFAVMHFKTKARSLNTASARASFNVEPACSMTNTKYTCSTRSMSTIKKQCCMLLQICRGNGNLCIERVCNYYVVPCPPRHIEADARPSETKQNLNHRIHLTAMTIN